LWTIRSEIRGFIMLAEWPGDIKWDAKQFRLPREPNIEYLREIAARANPSRTEKLVASCFDLECQPPTPP
jgi:hypothetical protein